MKEVVRAIIVNEQGLILLGRRAGGFEEGKYALVGGKPDSGETLQETIRREVKEELNLDFEPTLFLERLDEETDPQDPWYTYFFIGTASGVIRLKKDEISDVIFVSEADLDNLDIAFDHKDRLRDFFRQNLVDNE